MQQEGKTCGWDGCGYRLRKDNKSGYCQAHYYLAPSSKEWNKNWYQENKERISVATSKSRNYRDSTFKRFGITATDYYNMNELQNGKCAICNHEPVSRPKFLPLCSEASQTAFCTSSKWKKRRW